MPRSWVNDELAPIASTHCSKSRADSKADPRKETATATKVTAITPANKIRYLLATPTDKPTMPLIPHRLAHYVAQMWIFAGGVDLPCSSAATVRSKYQSGLTLALIAQNPFDRICALPAPASFMRSVKPLVTLPAIGSSMLVVSWVG